jgi:probable HAF family extracellular repeat protein
MVMSTYQYTVVDLGGFGPNLTCTPTSINNNRQVAGSGFVVEDSDGSAFLRSDGAHPTLNNLGVLPGDLDSAGVDINIVGDVVGWSRDEDANYHAVRWTSGQIVNLHSQQIVPLDFDNSIATGINDRGDVVGFAWASNNQSRQIGWLLPQGGGPLLNLTSQIDGTIIDAVAINNSGQIIGGLGTNGCYLYDPSLGQRPKVIPSGAPSRVFSINASGVVTGSTAVAAGGSPAGYFTWQVGEDSITTFYAGTDLPGIASDINTYGLIVGSIQDPVIGPYAYVYDGTIKRLNASLAGQNGNPATDWNITAANGVNDLGWIVGVGIRGDATLRGVLLVPSLGSSFVNPDLQIVAQILFGIVNDAPGVELVGGHPVPVPGWGGPFGYTIERLPAAQRDLLLGFSINELASLVQNQAARTEIQAAATKLIHGAVPRLNAPAVGVRAGSVPEAVRASRAGRFGLPPSRQRPKKSRK